MAAFRSAICTLVLLFGTSAALAEKEVYIPEAFGHDPALRTWSEARSYQSDNFVVFWGPVIEGDPRTFPDENLRFDPEAITSYLEACYNKYINELRFLSDGRRTNLGRYKLIVVMNDTWPEGGPSGWAFGGGYDDVIGAMWVHPGATRDGGVVSHELTHSLQVMARVQGESGTGAFTGADYLGFFWEAHANFMRLQLYPEMAGHDLPRWMATSSFHWGSTRHHYTSYHLLWTLQMHGGIEAVNRLWRESRPGEHPLETLTRLQRWNQSRLNDFIYEYAARQVCCDYPLNGFGQRMLDERERIARDEPHLLWRLWTVLDVIDADTGRYAVTDASAPQDYGFNLIPLHPTDAEVRITFRGHTEVNDAAGWRYGLVSVDGDEVTYHRPSSRNAGRLSHRLRSDTEALYLVVVGAPTTHHNYPWEIGWPKLHRYPYELVIEGALPEGHQPTFQQRYKTEGHAHPNGGGWVAATAEVSPEVFVGPRAIVLDHSQLSGQVRIEGTAWVQDTHASGTVVFGGNAKVWRGRFSDGVAIRDNAVLMDVQASGTTVFKDNALIWGGQYHGNAVIGGDAEVPGVATGYYLQVPHGNNGRALGDGFGPRDEPNRDINAPWQPFTDREMGVRRRD